jgi:hypothetical protein
MKEKILILVKTYPAISKKYFELVCTAGVNERGEWRRIYPIPFRNLPEIEKYKKYSWVNVDIERNTSDPRPESYKITPGTSIEILNESIGTSDKWRERKRIVLNQLELFNDLELLISKANDDNELSLAVFKPNRIIDFIVEETDREWSPEKVRLIDAKNEEMDWFDFDREIKIVDKLPYKFSYRFEDCNGKQSKLMIEDWEIGALYWKCLKMYGNEKDAVDGVIKKYKEEFLSYKDIYFFLGTQRLYHGWASNPYVITGVFYPPKTEDEQPDWFDMF